MLFSSPPALTPFAILSTTPLAQHDWHAVANTTAELAYSTYAGRKSNRWTFPNFYYTTAQMFQDDAGNTVTVETVMIDTVIACGLTVPHANGQPIPRSNDVEEGSNPIPSGATEWAWIEKTLAASTADVLLVSGHYPVYSIAEHGSTDCLVKQLQPLLVKNKVAMYFGGHDRAWERGRGAAVCGWLRRRVQVYAPALRVTPLPPPFF